ncbi:hypothetical protein SDRG_04095 [Saprolegnia diclina VS20]|uniref:Cyclic nucleotide-binding domain-containing protein n=1 Tax=Saprolegnia diclina (strain VS20) TaxID=1156394 RepID=T0S0D5_SAPDV|nr:hypothetical protein SDRG_04095 [Saprolegnia diclina VS20]EQC38383.1 hypothetical protein SDRG_04095 [Saprolegnia diclina VS20]|eukprot:XP_008607975.1 hypothetical protein SDRG_04095 [Saprolegnia diclina VS20]
MDFGDCVGIHYAGGEYGLTEVTSKQTVTHRKYSLLAQESCLVLAVRKDTIERAIVYTNPKPIMLYAKSTTLVDIHSTGRAKLRSYLSQYTLFSQLSVASQDRLVDHCQLKTFAPNEPLVALDGDWHDIIVVLSGQLGLYCIEVADNTADDTTSGTQRKVSALASYRLVGTIPSGQVYGDRHLWNDTNKRVDDPLHHWLLQRPFVSMLRAMESSDVVLIDRAEFALVLHTDCSDRPVLEVASIPPMERRPLDLAALHRWCISQAGLQQLPDAIVDRLVEVVTVLSFPAQKHVYNQASEVDATFFLVSGAVSLHDHAERPPQMVLPGDFFGHDAPLGHHRRLEIASTTESSVLLKIPRSACALWLDGLSSRLPLCASSLLAKCPLGRFAAREDVENVARLLHNLGLLTHVPLYVRLELVPYLVLQHVAEGDIICAEERDEVESIFVIVLRGQLGAYSRDHVDACSDALEGHPLCRSSSQLEPMPAAETDHPIGAVYGRRIHTFRRGDVLQTHGAVDGNGDYIVPMTILAHSASTLFVLRAQDVTGVLQRLGEPTKACWHLRAAVASVADDVSDTASLCSSLWFPPPTAVAHDVVAFAPGDKIVRIGDRLNAMYIFLDGIATASKMHTKHILSPMDVPLATALASVAVAPMRDITSNFKTTSKTLMTPRHEKRSKSVLPTIMKLSKRIPRLRMNAIVPEEPVVMTAPLSEKGVHATDGSNRRASASSLSSATSLHICWTFKAGDVYGGEIVFAAPATSLYNVVAETPLRALRITKAAYTSACTLAARLVPSVVQPKHIMAKAHWVRANLKVTEGITGHDAAKKPRFWNLVEEAVSQRVKLIIKHLANMTIFQSMSDETMSNIVASAKYDTFEKGHWIYTHGDAPKRYYVVVSGKVSLFSSLPSLEHVTLKRVRPGHGFGEFEILTNQMTRNLSAMAHDTTQLISFTAQTFTELWEDATLAAMRREVSFFQTLGWASRLDLDRIGHLYHAMTEVVYTKGTVIFPVHAKLNHVFILKRGICTLQAVVDVDSTRAPLRSTVKAKDAPPITIHVDLAQVATGHTIWAINSDFPYGLIATAADTAVVSIGYEMLRGIVPKWVHSDLNRDVAQQSSHHSHQLQLLRHRALGVLNLRSQLSAADQPRQEHNYYVPQLQAHSNTLSQQKATDDSRRVNLTMTDMVAAQPVELQNLFREDRRSSASDARTVDASLGLHLTNDREPHALGSFYIGRGMPVTPTLAPHRLHQHRRHDGADLRPRRQSNHN